MESLENVGALLRDYLAGRENDEAYNSLQIVLLGSHNHRDKVYECFFNWITEPTHSPESIIHLLDTYIRDLNGFSANRSVQTLVSFPCLEALARRRPGVLQGPWEKVAWIIIKYSACSNTMLGKTVTHPKNS